MIIACPECANPFELRDENIAALVQVECPSCSFRMILDFAAANDPSLVEAGMQMASGFRSAADYRAAIAPPPRHLEPVEPEPEPEPIVATPEPEPVVAQPLEPEPAVPEHQPASLESEGIPLVARAPAVDLDDEPPTSIVTPAKDFEEAPTSAQRPLRRPPSEPAPTPTSAPPRGETVVGPAPSPPRGETVIGPPPSPPQDLAVVPDASLEEDEAPTQIRTVESMSQGTVPEEARKTPHTLPSDKPAAKQPDDGAKRVEIKRKPVRPEGEVDEDRPKKSRPRFESQLPVVDEPPKSSALGTAVVVILALLAIGLVAASVAQKNTPDPRPLLEDLYRQYMK